MISYTRFKKKLSEHKSVVETTMFGGYTIEKTSSGAIFINGNETEYGTLEEARNYVKNKSLSEKLEKELNNEAYQDLPTVRIANIIREHKEVKITDTLIETYRNLASSKVFSADPVLTEIRQLNPLDKIVENKIHYILNDNSVVAINESTQEQLNKLFVSRNDVVEYMKESKDNFIKVVDLIRNS